MNYLDCVTEDINNCIDASLFGSIDARFKQFTGITEQVKRISGDKEVLFPAVYSADDNSELMYRGIDDLYQVSIYHRAISMTMADATTGKIGRNQADVIVKTKMCMVVFANVQTVHSTNHQMALEVQAAIPISTKIENIKLNKIKVSDIVLSSSQVFNEEYKNVDYFIKPEYIFIKVNYTLESTMSKQCFNNCSKKS